MNMKIYFCDLCNESIPQEDLEKNRVTTVRGKMICAKCVPPATSAAGAPGAAPVAAARGGSGLLAGALLLSLGIGVAALFVAWQTKTKQEAAPDVLPRLGDLARTCDRLLDDVSDLGKRIESLSATLAKVGEEPAAIREELAEHVRRLENEERATQAVRTVLDKLGGELDALEQLSVRLGGLEQNLAGVKGELKGVNDRVAVLSAMPSAPDRGADPAAGAAKEEGPQFDAETKKLLADLSNKDPSARWSAVDRLAKKHEVRLVPHLLPLLEDTDAFVQFRVINTLRELNARSAVGRLIKLLRDGDKIVREEAQEALITLTGNPQRFDFADGPPAEREKGAKAWEEWFEKNKERFAETTTSS